MRILGHDPAPVADVLYLNAAPRRGTETSTLRITTAAAHALPDALDAVVVASDLQGIVPDWEDDCRPVLLGIHLADRLPSVLAELGIADPRRVGVILAGDLYSAPTAARRGATGYVADVWRAFAETFRWVLGVRGNHDLFGSDEDEAALKNQGNVHLLDGEVEEVDGLRIGGVGLVCGRSDRPIRRGHRRAEEQLAAVQRTVAEGPDVLVLHEGPNGGPGQPGHARIRDILERDPVPLTVCGHSHWSPSCQFDLREDAQVLNVDGRAIIAMRRA